MQVSGRPWTRTTICSRSRGRHTGRCALPSSLDSSDSRAPQRRLQTTGQAQPRFNVPGALSIMDKAVHGRIPRHQWHQTTIPHNKTTYAVRHHKHHRLHATNKPTYDPNREADRAAARRRAMVGGNGVLSSSPPPPSAGSTVAMTGGGDAGAATEPCGNDAAAPE